MSLYTIGIDPGATGYIAFLDGDGEVAFTGTRDDVIRLLREHDDDIGVAYVERQFVMGIEGRKSLFSIAQDYGEIIGALSALGIAYELVRSQDWQKTMLRGEPKASGKALKSLYVAVASRRWPGVSFRGPKGGLIDGKAAAALIAEYGRRLTGGQHV